MTIYLQETLVEWGDDMFKVIDLETAGFKNSDDIAQVAIITLNDKLVPVSYYNKYFAIHEEMPEGAYKVNGLSKSLLEKLSGGVYFEELRDEVLTELQGHILVAHNAAFERRVLGYHLNHSLDEETWICTMQRYTPTLALRDHAGNNGYKQCNLRELTNFAITQAGITADKLNEMYESCVGSADTFHNALYDVYCTSFAFNVLG